MNKSAFKKIFAWTVIFIFVLNTFPVSSFAERGQRQIFTGVGKEAKHSIGRLLETEGYEASRLADLAVIACQKE